MKFVPDEQDGEAKFVPDEQSSSVAGKVGRFLWEHGTPFGMLGKAGPALDKLAYGSGGAVTDFASKFLPPEASGALGYATNVGVQAVPAFLGGSTATRVAAPIIEGGARQLMQSALKPSVEALEKGNAARAITTLLDEGVNVTPGGVAKLRSQIDVLNNEIAQQIASSGAVVDKAHVAGRLQDLINKFRLQVNPQSDINTIRKAWAEFLTHPMLQGTLNMPVQLAQQMKQGTYRALGSKPYGELGGAEIEAQKALARGLKEEIAAAIPGIERLNAQESQMLNALELTARRVLVDANKNPMGLGWLASNPGSWLGFAADRSPLVKSLLARLMHSSSSVVPRTAGTAAGAIAGSQMGDAE